MPDQPSGDKTHRIIANQIRDRIINGELQPGDRLAVESELSAELGVAHTTLREALRVLESQGLIRVQRGRQGGPVITHPDLGPIADALTIALQLQGTTISDLDAARQVIEPQIAADLAANHTDDDLAVLRTAIDDADTAAAARDIEAFARAAARMHETLMERSGNQTIATISRLLHQLVESYYSSATQLSDGRTMNRAVRSYRRLVELIDEGDAEAARAHWHAQMTYTISAHDPNVPVAITSLR